MSWFSRILPTSPAPKGSSPRDLIAAGELPLDRTPTSAEELAAFGTPGLYRPEAITNPDVQRQLLANEDYRNDIDEKKRFARHAYKLNWVWVVFLMTITVLQATGFRGFVLAEWSFNIVFGGLTTAVFGFAYLVGKYLFPEGGVNKRLPPDR
jgi:hypothetical protein